MNREWQNNSGFTLIEVSLAILMVTVGVLSLFSLFPLGLRESEMGVIETHEAMFADYLFSGIKGNVQDLTDWNTHYWDSDIIEYAKLAGKGLHGISVGKWENDGKGGAIIDSSAPDVALQFPEDAKPARYIRYKLTISGQGARKVIELWVKSGKYGEFDPTAQPYYTEMVYLGDKDLTSAKASML